MQRANHRYGRGYQAIVYETVQTVNPEEGEVEREQAEAEEDSVILRGDNVPIVVWNKFNTHCKEPNYIQINHIVGKLSGKKKITEEPIKKTQFEVMLDLKSLISAIDSELPRMKASMRRENRETTSTDRGQFSTISQKDGVFMDNRILVPVDLRRRLLDVSIMSVPGR